MLQDCLNPWSDVKKVTEVKLHEVCKCVIEMELSAASDAKME